MPEMASALMDATGVRAHPNAIGKFLRKLGFTYKIEEDQKTIQWGLLKKALFSDSLAVVRARRS